MRSSASLSPATMKYASASASEPFWIGVSAWFSTLLRMLNAVENVELPMALADRPQEEQTEKARVFWKVLV